jgi:hypothetical protein
MKYSNKDLYVLEGSLTKIFKKNAEISAPGLPYKEVPGREEKIQPVTLICVF